MTIYTTPTTYTVLRNCCLTGHCLFCLRKTPMGTPIRMVQVTTDDWALAESTALRWREYQSEMLENATLSETPTYITNHALRLRIVLDPKEVIPTDPGAGTPAMVEATLGWRYSATYLCAAETGELSCGDYLLTDIQVAWLWEQEPLVNEWLRVVTTFKEGN